MVKISPNILNSSESALNSLKKSDLVQKILDFKRKVFVLIYKISVKRLKDLQKT